jgi:uncharacterized protein YaaR (DUF327 family)
MSTSEKNKDKELTRLIEDVIDSGASTAEDIHRAVADLPIKVLDSLGLEEAAAGVKDIQDRSIGAIYDLIHEVNHKVGDLANDLLAHKKGRTPKNGDS